MPLTPLQQVCRARVVTLLARCETAALFTADKRLAHYGYDAASYARKLRSILADGVFDDGITGLVDTYAPGIADACERAERAPTMAQMRARKAALDRSSLAEVV